MKKNRAPVGDIQYYIFLDKFAMHLKHVISGCKCFMISCLVRLSMPATLFKRVIS